LHTSRDSGRLERVRAEKSDSAPQVLDQLLAQAEQAAASDVHLQMRNGCASISFRLDGVMTPVNELPEGLRNAFRPD